jgi:hypothetical protein
VAVDETSGSDYFDLTASADGSRVAALHSAGSAVWVEVRDVSGRALTDVPEPNASTFFMAPQLSPNGSKVAFTQAVLGTSSTTYSARITSVGSQTSTSLGTGIAVLGFLTDDVLLVQSTTTGVISSRAVSGGTATAVTGLPVQAEQLAVSPDSTKVAWAEDTTSGSGASTYDIHVATLTNSSGTWSASGGAVLATGLDNEEPAFSRDGATVSYVKYDGDVGPGDVWSRPFDLSAAETASTTAADELDVAVTAQPDAVAPGAATALAATLNGRTPTLRWALPADADLSGVLISRSGLVGDRFVPAPQTSFVDNGLALGGTYTYTFTAVDRSGNVAPGATRGLTALYPAPAFADPTSTTSARSSFPVTFAGTTAGASARFNVDYLVAGTTTWRHWVTGATGRARTFGAAATTGVLATTSTPGTSYSFRVQIKDAYGNASPWVTSGRAVVPYDQG